jgi:type II secretory pathway pseudopilin PulG
MSALLNQARSRVPRIAEAAVDRARLTVVPRRATTAPRVPFVMLVSLLLVGGVAGLLLFNTSMQQASFTATALEERAAVLDAREQSLQMQLETLRDPQRVAMEARRMGMVPPSNPAFIRLSDGKVLGDPTPATSLDAIRIAPLPTVKPKSLRPDPVVVEPPATDRKSRSDDGAASAEDEQADGTKKQRRGQERGQGGDR